MRVERGHVLIAAARQALGGGDVAHAEAKFAEAADLGERGARRDRRTVVTRGRTRARCRACHLVSREWRRCREPGLYFVGLHFLHAFSSTMIHGIARDAKRIVDAIGLRSQPNAVNVSYRAGKPRPVSRYTANVPSQWPPS